MTAFVGRIKTADICNEVYGEGALPPTLYGLALDVESDAGEKAHVFLPAMQSILIGETQSLMSDFLNSISRPAYRDMKDLIGIEVTIDPVSRIVRPTGATRVYPLSHGEKELRAFRDTIAHEGESGWRHRRLYMCRAIGDIKTLIDNLPAPAHDIERIQMKNLAEALLQLYLFKNDGHVRNQ